MDIIDQTPTHTTISLDKHEIYMMLCYIQTAREELECTTAKGEELDQKFRSVAAGFQRVGAQVVRH